MLSRGALLTVLANQGVPSKAPNLVTGLTGWWEAFDASTLYTDAGTTPVSADSDLVYQMNDKSGNNRHWVQATEARRPLYKVNLQNGKSGLDFDGTNHGMGGLTLANLFGASAKTLFLAVKINVLTASGFIFGDSSGYWNSTMQNPSTLWQTANYDGTTNLTTGITVAAGAALLYTYYHDGVNHADQKNNGAITTPVAAGATALMTPSVYIGGLFGVSLMLDGEFYGAATYNEVVAEADRAAVNLYFMNQLAIT